MAKPNAKSIRFSDEVRDIIENAPGEGFNEKFEGLILAYANSIPERERVLENIMRRIVDQKAKLNSLIQQSRQLERTIYDMHQVNDLVKKMISDIDVSQEAQKKTPRSNDDENEIQKFDKAYRNFTGS